MSDDENHVSSEANKEPQPLTGKPGLMCLRHLIELDAMEKCLASAFLYYSVLRRNKDVFLCRQEVIREQKGKEG